MKLTYAELREQYGPNAFKLYAHMDFHSSFLIPTEAPKRVQFKTGLDYLKPQKVINMRGGEPLNAVYYESKDENAVGVSPLAKIDFEWLRTEPVNGETRLLKRKAVACWTQVGEDDSDVVWATDEDFLKRWDKDYNEREGRLADKRKRANIIDELLSQVGPFGVLSYVQTMLNSLDDERNGYIDTYDARFLAKLASYSGSWLETDVSAPLGLPAGTTLRMAIMGSLDYDYKVVPKPGS